ncbi:peptidoglycan editing factor PgeF [Shewanella waksmanii]|uniref:peptidoglycan editing factor PgeF n=1 Tax=Shewanella waksmanii TaxID=213783 RepID=UPI003735FEF4
MIPANWFIPNGVKLVFTTRAGGVSGAPYDSLNLGDHVGDSPEAVAENRKRLQQIYGLDTCLPWLEQVHGTCVVNLDNDNNRTADGSFTTSQHQVCVVMTADCLPVLLCDRGGKQLAAVHAGWRGLCDGVIESALTQFTGDSRDIIAYLGPAIGQQSFEVGPEVRAAFTAVDAASQQYFRSFGDKYLADLQGLAARRLNLSGVEQVYTLGHCTYQNASDYFSYRRETTTGRMASLIWRE